MKICILTGALLLAACAQPTEETAIDNVDAVGVAPQPEAGSNGDGGTPFAVPSDSRASYSLLKVERGDGRNIIATTRREGPSGISYSRREVNCSEGTFRYVGEGDTLAEANEPAPNPGEMSGGVEGSISDVAAKFACANQ